ncbi:hypothetical protein SLEP1_g39185 [Rubroshorea leprosula]|uniref:Uncharacterized protein n=1 Tax=Rubroshorea leprosula TaxID=152421 RepID=A0AAV5L047_9ROSI|nr:hypothetical protein SLEP1_g39185 [Rubroshorea leprosula]
MQIKSLDLSGNNLDGMLPEIIGNLSGCLQLSLEALILGGNKIKGPLPDMIKTFSSLQVNAEILAVLDVSNNQFSGQLPECMTQWTSLVILNLANNHLLGKIPSSIGSLARLESLAMLVDKYYVARPLQQQSVGKHTQIGIYNDEASVMWKGMDCDYGNGNLRNLRIIDLSSNKLTGEIPVQISDIGQMRELESLDLSWNQLSGHLPESMSQLNFLSTLNLSHNNFSGRIPLSTQMQSFDVSSFVGNRALCGLPLTPTDNGDKENQEDRAEFWKSFKPSVELGAAIGFVGVLAMKLDHPWKHFCFLLFNNVRVRLSNLKDYLYLLVAVVGLVVREHVSRLGRKLKLFEPSIPS